MYDKRFHNEKHNVKASIAVGLPGLFSPSEWNNVEASKRINVATESITEVENTMEMMIPWVITQVIATNTGILVIWSPSAIVLHHHLTGSAKESQKKISCDFSVWYASDLWSSCAWSSEGILVKSAFSVTCRWHAASCCQVWTLSEGSALVKLRNLHGIQPRIYQLWTALGHFGQGNPCAFLIHLISFDDIWWYILIYFVYNVRQGTPNKSS